MLLCWRSLGLKCFIAIYTVAAVQMTIKPWNLKYLHDDELEHQLGDVSRRQVEQEGSVPDGIRTARPFGLLRTDNLPILTQVDDNVVVCGEKIR